MAEMSPARAMKALPIPMPLAPTGIVRNSAARLPTWEKSSTLPRRGLAIEPVAAASMAGTNSAASSPERKIFILNTIMYPPYCWIRLFTFRYSILRSMYDRKLAHLLATGFVIFDLVNVIAASNFLVEARADTPRFRAGPVGMLD